MPQQQNGLSPGDELADFFVGIHVERHVERHAHARQLDRLAA